MTSVLLLPSGCSATLQCVAFQWWLQLLQRPRVAVALSNQVCHVAAAKEFKGVPSWDIVLLPVMQLWIFCMGKAALV